MFSNLYPFAFVASLGSLTLWFYLREDERRSEFVRKLFYVSIIAFGASWMFSKGEMPYKFVMLGRELVVLAVVPVVLSLFRKVKWAYIAMLIGTFGLLKVFYFKDLKNTFPQKHEMALASPLDKEGELLIEMKEGSQITDIQAILKKFGLVAKPAFSMSDRNATDLDDFFVVNVPPDFESSLEQIRAALEGTGHIEWVENNEQMALSPLEAEPQRTVPGANKKFGMNDPGLEFLWGFEEMKMNELFEILKDAKPAKRAKIAILDTGIDGSHEDIQANFTSTQTKYNTDRAGHGTHCAGIAAAVSNNGKGVASFSQNNEFVQVTSVKVLSDGGFGTQQMIINGILEASDAGADVISLSLGGISSDSKQRSYQKAVKYANEKGAIVIVAAGNSNRSAVDYAPANTPGVIAVSAVDTVLGKASFSNTVDELKMGVAAPGVKIYSTFPGSQYQTFNGTSMATPYVAGLTGLLKSLRPSLTTEEVYKILNETGVGTKQSKETGKFIQPAAAVKKLLN